MLFNKNISILDTKYYSANKKYYNTDYLGYFYYVICYYFQEQAMIKKNLSLKIIIHYLLL